jgi:hypothetical protein
LGLAVLFYIPWLSRSLRLEQSGLTERVELGVNAANA